MNLLASAFGGVALWLVLGGLVVVVVGGAVAVTAVLLNLVRAISASAQELGQLRDVLTQQQTGQRTSSEPSDGSETKDREPGGAPEG